MSGSLLRRIFIDPGTSGTAAEAAVELEVSERTARRDLEALGFAGLPVYPTRGRNGGWALAGGGRTDLSGLNAAEVRALFLLAGPSSPMSSELRAALRKLVRALPESFRSSAEAATRAIVADPFGWESTADGRRPDPPFLASVQQAVVESRQALLEYIAANGETTTRVVHPLGLAVKGSLWYLVAGTDRGQRTFRVDRIHSVTPCNEAVVRPKDFDLIEAWRSITVEIDERRAPLRARASVAPEMMPTIRWIFGNRVRIGPPVADGRVEVELRGPNTRSLAGQIAGFASAIEVLEPKEIRDQLAEIAYELTSFYGSPTVPTSETAV